MKPGRNQKAVGHSRSPKPDDDRTSSEKTDAAEETPAENAARGSETAAGEEPTTAPPESELETLLSVYPLREPEEDPRWALRTVWIWMGFVLLSLAFILTLLVLGAIYD